MGLTAEKPDRSERSVDSERLKRVVADFRQRWEVAGVAVAVRRRGTPIYSDAIGNASLAPKRPTTRQTVFAAGSITKQIVAAATLRACEDKLISLDTPVKQILKGADAFHADLRVHHLLSQTSGIVYDIGLDRSDDTSLRGAIVAIAAQSTHTPGEHWIYNNTNYFLLGHVLAEITHEPLADFVSRSVLPNGVRRNLAFAGIEVASRLRAIGYARTSNGLGTVDPPDANRSFGSGTLFATADALAEWTSSLWSGAIIAETSLSAMRTRVVLADGGATSYGLGCFVSDADGLIELSHDGHTAGFSSQSAYYPDVDLAICVLTNSAEHLAEVLEKEIRDVVLGRPAPLRDAAATTEQSLDQFTGTFAAGARMATAYVRGAALFLSTRTELETEFIPVGPGKFRQRHGGLMRYEFHCTEGAIELHVARGGKTLAVLRRT